MKSQHTPGPWSLETVQTSVGLCHKVGPFPTPNGVRPEGWACVYEDGLSKQVEHARGTLRSELLANAHLIAAAPRMKDALLYVLEHSGDPVMENVARAALVEAGIDLGVPSGAVEPEQEQNDHDGTGLTEGDAVSVSVPADQLPHDARPLDPVTDLRLCGTYTVSLSGPDEDGDFFARVNELSGCITHAADPVDVIQRIGTAMGEWVAAARASGVGLPVPTLAHHASASGGNQGAQGHATATSASAAPSSSSSSNDREASSVEQAIKVLLLWIDDFGTHRFEDRPREAVRVREEIVDCISALIQAVREEPR